jgi:hypothetical protein
MLTDDAQIQALAAAIARLLEYQKFRMELREQHRLKGLKKPYQVFRREDSTKSGVATPPAISAVIDRAYTPKQLELWAA